MPKKTNFTANGNQYFRTTATIGKKPDGAPLRKSFYGTSKREADEKKAEYLSSLKHGLAVNYDKATFGLAFAAWFENVLPLGISLSTYNRYEIDYRKRIKDCELNSMRLVDIRAANIQAFYNKLLGTVTPKTVHSVHRVLNQFFNYAVEADLLIKSPLLAVELPKVATQSEVNKALPDSDIERLLQAAKDDITNFIYVFAVFTGLREGEILALTHKDIDIDKGVITVNKSVKYLTVDGAYQPVLSSTKTKSSERTIPILGAIDELLAAHRRHEIAKHFRLGIPLKKDSIFFSSTACTYQEAANVLKRLKRLCKQIGIESTTFHSLRHSFCTLLAKQGVPLKTASELAGHSNISTTARIYTHVDDTEKRRGIEKLAVYFN